MTGCFIGVDRPSSAAISLLYAFYGDIKICIYPIFRQITRVLSIQKRPKFVKNEHAQYTLGMKKGKNLEKLITATSQARFQE